MTKKKYWINNLNLVEKYITDNNKRPFSNNINKSISSLGNWLQFQIINYKNNKGIIQEPEIKKLWEKFTKEYSDYV
jgi:hypothetical protein